MRLKDVYRFPDPYEVEVVARVCRKWTPEDDEILDPEAVKLAENIYKVCGEAKDAQRLLWTSKKKRILNNFNNTVG